MSRLCALPAKALIRRLLRIALTGGAGAPKKFRGMSNPAATVDLMTMVRSDYLELAGMYTASTAALSCADLAGGNVPFWTIQAEPRGGASRHSRFRLLHHQPSAPAVGVRPDRKLGPEEQSHKSLTLGVCAAGNVA